MKQFSQFTDAQIEALETRDKGYAVRDGSGMYLWISPAGAKSWRWAYRFGGKENVVVYGRWPQVGRLKAVALHARGKLDLETGIDPAARNREAKAARKEREAATAGVQIPDDAFRKIGEKWFAWWREGKNPRHVRTVRARLESDLYPALGDKSIGEIGWLDVVEMARAIEKRGVHDTARRAIQRVGEIFEYAMLNGLCGSEVHNPARDIKPSKILKQSDPGEFAFLPERNMPELMAAIDNYSGQASIRFAIQFQALTFVRISELIGARWSEINWHEALWIIPAERMKRVRNRRPLDHYVPLAPQAVELLKHLQQISNKSEFLFPGTGGNPTIAGGSVLLAFARMGYKNQMTTHGWRKMASTWLNEQGFPPDHIEKQLSHVPADKVRSSYNHALFLVQRRRLMEAWANHLDDLRKRGQNPVWSQEKAS